MLRIVSIQGEDILTTVAISFTMCSMTSALQMSPPECSAWEERNMEQPSVTWPHDIAGQRSLCLA